MKLRFMEHNRKNAINAEAFRNIHKYQIDHSVFLQKPQVWTRLIRKGGVRVGRGGGRLWVRRPSTSGLTNPTWHTIGGRYKLSPTYLWANLSDTRIDGDLGHTWYGPFKINSFTNVDESFVLSGSISSNNQDRGAVISMFQRKRQQKLWYSSLKLGVWEF